MNILVITPIYPGPGVGQNYTKVVHYFTKEWVKQGENVQVVSIPSYFPRFMYHMPTWSTKLLQKTISATIPTTRNSIIENYEIDNVPVLRVPLYKLHPFTTSKDKVLLRAARNIIRGLSKQNFVPDIIVGHWFDPTLFFIDYLKSYYKCKASLVIHNHSFKYLKYWKSPDLWGCRKIDTAKVISNIQPEIEISFRCYSGIPEIFLDNIPKRDWRECNRIIYVGTLIKRKYPDIIINALALSDIKDFDFRIIGEGALESKIKREISLRGLGDKVHLLGRKTRQEIINELDQSDIFIMISEGEVFGLVYIEAMARGCIVIASRNEGMEGIIKNGENGFLTKAGDQDELKNVINQILNLPIEEKRKISINAINTARDLTDKKVAKEYLDTLYSLINREDKIK